MENYRLKLTETFSKKVKFFHIDFKCTKFQQFIDWPIKKYPLNNNWLGKF